MNDKGGNIIENLLIICIALSIGAACGMAGGVVRTALRKMRKKDYTDKQIAAYQKVWKTGSRILTFITCLLLTLGLIWCVYFLVLGAVYPEQTEYANNMAELIVAVLTVVSIIFAFYEFIRRK